MINYLESTTDQHLQQILDLQAQNLARNISEEEAADQGFVTLSHSLPLLRTMNEPFHHSIALDGETIAGYALFSELHHFDHFPEMRPALDILNAIEYQGKLLQESRYFFMGQICVAKPYRGKGVFAGLYEHQRQTLSHAYKYNVTIISSLNKRSIRAHEKVGFQTIKRVPQPGGYDWEVVLWDWG